MDMIKYVGNRIRELRLGYGAGEGISQETLANALEVATNTISRWETGTYHTRLEDLEKLSRFFGVSILEFFPQADISEDSNLIVLLRTAKDLSSKDVEELQKYAEFRRARSLYSEGKKPHIGRARKESDK